MWMTDSAYQQYKTDFLALTEDQQKALDWKSATKYVPRDTICINMWLGMKSDPDLTPYEALRLIHNNQ